MNQYHADSYRTELDTVLKYRFEDDGAFFAELEETIFHPHGGGQKGDRGTITIEGQAFQVVNTVKDENSGNGTLAVLDRDMPDDLKGKPAHCELDWDFRYAQMRLHTAAHLHHCMVEKAAGKTVKPPVTSNIEEAFAFNRYEKNSLEDELIQQANELFAETVAQGGEVVTYDDDARCDARWWECLGYKIPCGGTHVKDIKELEGLSIQVSRKKGMPTIKFVLE